MVSHYQHRRSTACSFGSIIFINHMQNQVTVSVVVLVAVAQPVAAFYMQLYITHQQGITYPYFGFKEVGTGIPVQLTAIYYCKRLTTSCAETGNLVKAILPDELEEGFVHFE